MQIHYMQNDIIDKEIVVLKVPMWLPRLCFDYITTLDTNTFESCYV